MRIAVWSGPRNISTAMMRSWGNRPDTFVCDEPLYAHYLRNTDVEHPGRDEVIASQENDWRKGPARDPGPAKGGHSTFQARKRKGKRGTFYFSEAGDRRKGISRDKSNFSVRDTH